MFRVRLSLLARLSGKRLDSAPFGRAIRHRLSSPSPPRTPTTTARRAGVHGSATGAVRRSSAIGVRRAVAAPTSARGTVGPAARGTVSLIRCSTLGHAVTVHARAGQPSDQHAQRRRQFQIPYRCGQGLDVPDITALETASRLRVHATEGECVTRVDGCDAPSYYSPIWNSKA